MSDVDTTIRSITSFAGEVLSTISLIPGQLLNQVIECLRAATKHKQDLRKARITLAFSLCVVI
jgi:hypothetical protein